MLPRNLRPMRLSRRSEPFDSADFISELKIDGFRALVHIGNGRGELISRNGNVFRGFASSLFAQTPADQQRIVEPIIVNGQEVQGVLVLQNGAVQSYTCSSPQPYTTANQSESGWACFDQATGMWLLHAQPPLQATAPPQPTIVYSQPTPAYVPAPVYDYGYGYYPYPYY